MEGTSRKEILERELPGSFKYCVLDEPNTEEDIKDGKKYLDVLCDALALVRTLTIRELFGSQRLVKA